MRKLTKRECLNKMIEKMEEYEVVLEERKGTFETALDIHNLHQEYIKAALKIAEDNGYTDDAKWQLWKETINHFERKLGIKPDNNII